MQRNSHANVCVVKRVEGRPIYIKNSYVFKDKDKDRITRRFAFIAYSCVQYFTQKNMCRAWQTNNR